MFQWQKREKKGKKRKQKAKIKPITRGEMARMLVAERRSGRRDMKRNCLVMLLIFYTGLRVEELCLQRVSDFGGWKETEGGMQRAETESGSGGGGRRAETEAETEDGGRIAEGGYGRRITEGG